MKRLGIFLGILLGVIAFGSSAFGAPDRLTDDIPDAVPDQPHSFSFSYGHEFIDVEGHLNDERTAHDYFKIRYTFSPEIAASFKLKKHDLVGGLGLLNPMLDLQDNAESFTIDLGINLMNIPMIPADEEAKVAFVAGSSFGMGVSGTKFTLDQANLKRDETLLKAYLMYSTDLSEEMRAHTYFSSGRLSGDAHTGSVNRVGAGLDYDLISGPRPLTLMINGMLDIYNFREPVFNTSRISRFDMGLRYRVARDWYASAGWVTLNDSENDASGSGVFAGMNFIPNSPPLEECVECEEEEVPAEADDTTAASLPQTNSTEQVENPPLMALNNNGFSLQESSLASLKENETITNAKSANSSAENLPQKHIDNGISIPAYPGVQPVQTSESAVMIRPNMPVSAPQIDVTKDTDETTMPLIEPLALDPSANNSPKRDELVMVSNSGRAGLLSVSPTSFSKANTLDQPVHIQLFDNSMEPVEMARLKSGGWWVFCNAGLPKE